MDIVIVDDQPSARTMLRHIVQDIGPQLDVYDFGEPDTALAWCNSNRPDLLLLDYRMPPPRASPWTSAIVRTSPPSDACRW